MKKGKQISLYWKCQLIGWSAAALYWGIVGYLGEGFNLLFGLGQYLTDICCYILLSHLYRIFAIQHHWQELNLKQLIQRIIPAAFMLGVGYTLVTVVKIYLLQLLFHIGPISTFSAFLNANGLSIFMAGLRLMSIWLLAYHLYHYAQREIRISSENSRLAMLNKEVQLSMLSAQLNPHFLFNSLNNIKALTAIEPRSARRGIDLLAELLRHNLYSNYELLTSIKKELQLVKDYLELEALRLEDRLSYRISVAEEVMDVLILRLSIQTLVENAIKHGISQLKNGGLLEINIQREVEWLKITVWQPGVLKMTDAEQGIGLRNLQERLLLTYKGKAVFELFQQEEKVGAQLQIPIR